MMNGAQKLFGMFGGEAVAIASLPGAAGIIEFVGGLLVMVGLLTGIAAFIASGEMAFAYFMVHFPQGGWPIQNNGQLAVLFCFIFLFIAARGAGILSLDRLFFARTAERMR
jgi:putative oxidoreductase